MPSPAGPKSASRRHPDPTTKPKFIPFVKTSGKKKPLVKGK